MSLNQIKLCTYVSIFILVLLITSCYENPMGVGLADNIPPTIILHEPIDQSVFTDKDTRINLRIEASDFWGINNVEVFVNNKTLRSEDYLSDGSFNPTILHSDSVNKIWAIAYDENGNQGISNKVGIYFNRTIILKKNLDTLVLLDNDPPYTLDLNDYFLDTLMGNSNLEYSVSISPKKGMIDIVTPENLIVINPVRFFSGEVTCKVIAKNGKRSNNIKFVIKVKLSEKVKKIYIPDNNFRTQLIKNHNFADFKDDSVAQAQVEELTELDLFSQNYSTRIKDFEGLQYFINLTSLNVANNKIEQIDLSNQIKLKKLNCSNNNFRTINLSNFPELEELNLLFNYNVSNLDVSSNLLLKKLYCDIIDKTIDLSKNISLEDLYFGECRLAHINLAKNVNLKYFGSASHDLTKVDLSKNIKLEKLAIQFSLLKELDIRYNQKLTSINLTYNDDLIKTIVWVLPLPNNINIEKDDRNMFVTN